MVAARPWPKHSSPRLGLDWRSHTPLSFIKFVDEDSNDRTASRAHPWRQRWYRLGSTSCLGGSLTVDPMLRIEHASDHTRSQTSELGLASHLCKIKARQLCNEQRKSDADGGDKSSAMLLLGEHEDLISREQCTCQGSVHRRCL